MQYSQEKSSLRHVVPSGHVCVCVCVRVCGHGCCTVPQSREIRMELSHICPAAGFSDLSLKHLVLASIRDRILTLVSKQVWQFPYFQALDTNRLFPSRGWLMFLANADSQMPLLHSLLLLIYNLRLKVKGLILVVPMQGKSI